MAVEFAEKVEGVDVGHGRNVVDNGLHAREDVGGIHVILLGHLRQEQL